MEFAGAPKEPASSHNQGRTNGSAPKMPDVETEWITSPNSGRRQQANQWSISDVQSMGAPLTSESLHQLKEPLNKGNNGARKEAIRQIWRHASSDALREECISIFSSVLNYCGDWKVRREAAMRLGQISCPSAEKALKQALNDVRVPVREQVVDSLRRISTVLSKTTETELGNLPPAENH
jgi:HEAT repeat protein